MSRKRAAVSILNYFGKRNQVGNESDDSTEPEDEANVTLEDGNSSDRDSHSCNAALLAQALAAKPHNFINDPANGKLAREQIKVLGPCQPTDINFPMTK